MAVRVIQVLSWVCLVAAGLVFGVCAVQIGDSEPPDRVALYPSVVEVFRAQSRNREPAEEPGLVVQARSLANYLNPPRTTLKPTVVASRAALVRAPVAPPRPSPKFRVHATCYYPARPERSVALISEAGGASEDRRWVREGVQIGHFVVREIRTDSIVCRAQNSDQVLELVVNPDVPSNSLVRRHIGVAQANAVTGGIDVDANQSDELIR